MRSAHNLRKGWNYDRKSSLTPFSPSVNFDIRRRTLRVSTVSTSDRESNKGSSPPLALEQAVESGTDIINKLANAV